VVIARHAEGYRVDIGSAQAAALDALAFEDATKRNKPDLKVRLNYLQLSEVVVLSAFDRLELSSMLESRSLYPSANPKSNAWTPRLASLQASELSQAVC
jgi:exosome complex RNA-binding protein Rrp4